jgi:LysM repeat protein
MDDNTPGNSKISLDKAIDLLGDYRNVRSKKDNRLLSRCIGGLLILIILFTVFSGFLQYSLSQRINEMAMKLTNLEFRIRGLEIQRAELQAKSPNSVTGNDVETLSSRVSVLEERITPSQTHEKSSTDSSKQAKAIKKHYHEVKKGETLYRISKQYGTTVDELRRLNQLSPNQPIEVGQKLLVS